MCVVPSRATKKAERASVVGERLRYWRERLGWTQGELEQKMHASGGVVSRWESGAREPSPKKLVKAAEVMGIDAKDLIGENLSPSRQPLIDVPILSWVNAGELADPEGGSDPSSMAEMSITVMSTRRTLFGLEVKGNSMDRVAPSGAFIVIDYEDRELVPGAYYVFRHRGKVGFKRYMKGPARLESYSTEPDHPTIFPDDTTEVIGRLDQAIRRFR